MSWGLAGGNQADTPGCGQHSVSSLSISASDIWPLALALHQGDEETVEYGVGFSCVRSEGVLTFLSPPSSLRALLPWNWENSAATATGTAGHVFVKPRGEGLRAFWGIFFPLSVGAEEMWDQ